MTIFTESFVPWTISYLYLVKPGRSPQVGEWVKVCGAWEDKVSFSTIPELLSNLPHKEPQHSSDGCHLFASLYAPFMGQIAPVDHFGKVLCIIGALNYHHCPASKHLKPKSLFSLANLIPQGFIILPPVDPKPQIIGQSPNYTFKLCSVTKDTFSG